MMDWTKIGRDMTEEGPGGIARRTLTKMRCTHRPYDIVKLLNMVYRSAGVRATHLDEFALRDQFP